MSPMSISVNGVRKDVTGARTIADVVARLELTGKRIAVERNGEVIPRSRYAETPVAHGDRLEIVGAVGGG